jgi:type IV secretory pathway TraG/TraD family ATPase VirD4
VVPFAGKSRAISRYTSIIELPHRVAGIHSGTVISHELLLRAAMDAWFILVGLLCALWVRGASRGRLIAAPAIAILLAGPAAIAAGALAHLVPASKALAPPERLVVAELGACLLLGVLVAARTPGIRGPVRVLRGTRIIDGAPGRWHPRSSSTLRFAGIDVPASDEAKHFKVIGTTGTGKTTAIRALLDEALRRGDRAVIADPDGTYATQFQDPRRGDLRLNPLDDGAATWDLFAEVKRPEDTDLLARALIPEQGGEDRAWRAYARVFLSSLLRQLLHAGERDVLLLHRLVAYASAEELRELLDGTAAAAYVSQDNARFLASVRAIASSDLAALEFVGAPRKAPRIAVRDWIRTAAPGGGGPALFLPYRSGQLATLRGLLATWMRLAIFEAMEARDGGPPLWFVIDELDALGAVDGLKDALARLRKYGGRCVLGLQSIAQLSGTYGAPAAQTIVENCGNTLLLRCSAGENGGTARFASTLIGEREVLREQVSRTRPLAFGRGDRSRSETVQRTVERAVLPAEIEQLPDGHGYVKLASSAAWNRIVLDR